MLRLARRLRVGLDHADQDLAARIAGAADEIFLAVDDPFVAALLRLRAHVHDRRAREKGGIEA